MRDKDRDDLKIFWSPVQFSRKYAEIRLFKLASSSDEEKNSTSGSNASGACMHCAFGICNKPKSSFAIVRCINHGCQVVSTYIETPDESSAYVHCVVSVYPSKNASKEICLHLHIYIDKTNIKLQMTEFNCQ
ncbi:hypothetical protein T11_7373 [Trichinella zimbabwensis]|uniref:Uncharacterized protein n=1 Tax=Trichinella zimbabwensis TaxID=268475 RepID=A0A0V1GWH2_9BILA|nr:hypothetical protein T11_7373 [Trichinella zimbabwensis]